MAKLPNNFKETANKRFLDATRFWQNWKGDARESFDFIAGEQWVSEDKALLKEQQRPNVVFNYSEKMIDAVVGAEVSNRQEVTYAPRTMGMAGAAELWTNAAKWVRDEADIGDEETEMFRDCLICGMGWTHTRVSYEVEPDGMIETNRIDPCEMIADPSATKPGLIDRRYSFHFVWIDEGVAKREWPNSISFEENVNTGSGTDEIRRGHRYEGDEADDPDMHRGQVQVRHYECVELEPFYRVASENKIIDIDNADFAVMKSSLDEKGIKYIKQFKRVYYYAYFAGDTLLEGGLSPTQEGFTYQCVTGKRDRNKNTWYGLTRVMKDPQRWANKWLSQILHIVNSNAKGGLLAEVGAFVDSERAQNDWASPDSIVFLKEGGMGKVKEKQMSSYPSGLDRLMEFALSSLPQVTGINLEALGLAAREQANVLEQSRKQAAYGLLAPIFDSLRRYRKQHGRVLLDFIHNYISDGRLIRIGGPESQQYLPLTKTTDAPTYDIIVDQSPESPDVKEKTWGVLENVIPAMMKAGVPIPPFIIDYVPLPVALSTQWKQYMQQNPPVNQAQVQQLHQQVGQLTQQNQQLTMKLQDKSQEIAMKGQEMSKMMQLREQEAQAKMAINAQEASANFNLKRQEVAANIHANLLDIFQQGHLDAASNIMDAVNKLISTVASIQAEDADDSEDNPT